MGKNTKISVIGSTKLITIIPNQSGIYQMIEPRLLAENLNSVYSIQLHSDVDCELELVEAEILPHKHNSGTSEPTSLTFRYSLDLKLQQGTYSLKHAKLGTFDIFLVPQSPDQQFNYMEAVFN